MRQPEKSFERRSLKLFGHGGWSARDTAQQGKIAVAYGDIRFQRGADHLLVGFIDLVHIIKSESRRGGQAGLPVQGVVLGRGKHIAYHAHGAPGGAGTEEGPNQIRPLGNTPYGQRVA